jgi:hypothetical protein
MLSCGTERRGADPRDVEAALILVLAIERVP